MSNPPLYVAPYLDAAGMHLPAYSAILDYLLTAYQNIYTGGAYLANDSADYQEISITAGHCPKPIG